MNARGRNERIRGSFSRFSGYPGSRRHRPKPSAARTRTAFRLLTASRGVTNPGFCAKIGVEDKEGRGLLRGVSPRWNTETWCETPFKNSRNAHTLTRAHTHSRHSKRGTEETSKWRVQFLARIEHEGFIGGAAEFSWNLAVKKIGYPASKNLWWSRILIR